MFSVGQRYFSASDEDIPRPGDEPSDDLAPVTLLVREAIELVQFAEVEIGQPLDREHRALVGLEGTEQERLLSQIDVVIDEVCGRGRSAVVMDEGDDLPIGERDRNAAVDQVVLAENRACKNARALTDPAGVAEDTPPTVSNYSTTHTMPPLLQ